MTALQTPKQIRLRSVLGWDVMGKNLPVNIYTVLSPHGLPSRESEWVDGRCFVKGKFGLHNGRETNWPKEWILTTNDGHAFAEGKKYAVWRSVGEYGAKVKYVADEQELDRVLCNLIAGKKVEFDRVIEDKLS